MNTEVSSYHKHTDEQTEKPSFQVGGSYISFPFPPIPSKVHLAQKRYIGTKRSTDQEILYLLKHLWLAGKTLKHHFYLDISMEARVTIKGKKAIKK